MKYFIRLVAFIFNYYLSLRSQRNYYPIYFSSVFFINLTLRHIRSLMHFIPNSHIHSQFTHSFNERHLITILLIFVIEARPINLGKSIFKFIHLPPPWEGAQVDTKSGIFCKRQGQGVLTHK